MTNSNDDREGAFPDQLKKFQCFLIENWRDFTAYNQGVPYKNFTKLLSNDPQMTSVHIMNNLTGTRSIDALNVLDPEYLGILVPELRLYRSDIISGEWVNTEFRFPNFTNPDVSQMLAGASSRFPGAGIKSFEIVNEGNNQVETTVALKANLDLHLTSLDELEKPRGTVNDPTPEFVRFNTAEAGTRTLRITDLMLRPRERNEINFRIKATVGWALPSRINIPEEKLTQLRDYVNRARKTYTLVPAMHTIDLNEDGSVRISCEFLASVDAALRGDNPNPSSSRALDYELMGVLQGALEEQDLQTYLRERKRIIRRQEYLDCEEQQSNRRGAGGTGDSEPTEEQTETSEAIADERQTLDQRLARNKGFLYNKFVDALLRKSAVHYIDLSGPELGLPSAPAEQRLRHPNDPTPGRIGSRGESALLRRLRAESIEAFRNSERVQALDPPARNGAITNYENQVRERHLDDTLLFDYYRDNSPTPDQASPTDQRSDDLTAIATSLAETTASVFAPEATTDDIASAVATEHGAFIAFASRIHTLTYEQIEAGETSVARLDVLEGDSDSAVERNLQSIAEANPREIGKHRLHFVYLGDLINIGLEYFRHPSIPYEMKTLMPIVAPTQMFPIDVSLESQQISIADIPISLKNIQTWFLNKIVAADKVTINFNEWMRLISNNLLKQASGQRCVEAGEQQTTRTLTLAVEKIASPHPTLHRTDLSVPTGVNVITTYSPISATPSMTARESLNSKNYLFIHSPIQSLRELSVFSSTDNGGRYSTRRERDAANNIFHLIHGARKGIVKSIKYTKRENGALTDSNIHAALQQNNGSYGAIDVNPYDASVRLYGNSYFTPMNLVKISPTFHGSSATRLLRNISGYYSVQKVRSIIEPGKFETELQCIWTQPDVSRTPSADVPNAEAGQENNEPCPEAAPVTDPQPSVAQVDENIRRQTGIQVDRPTGDAPVLRPRSGRGRQF